VDVLREDDPIYVHLSRAFELAPGATLSLDSCTVLGLEISRAVIFALTKPLPNRARPRASKPRTKSARATSTSRTRGSKRGR
jgi:hypothetical protein